MTYVRVLYFMLVCLCGIPTLAVAGEPLLPKDTTRTVEQFRRHIASCVEGSGCELKVSPELYAKRNGYGSPREILQAVNNARIVACTGENSYDHVNPDGSLSLGPPRACYENERWLVLPNGVVVSLACGNTREGVEAMPQKAVNTTPRSKLNYVCAPVYPGNTTTTLGTNMPTHVGNLGGTQCAWVLGK